MEESVTKVSHRVLSEADKDESRQKPHGRPNSAAKVDAAVPHYLRASTGSCHDICKYGKQHDLESKKRRPIRRKSAPVADRDIPVEILVPADRNKKRAEKPSSHDQPLAMPDAASLTSEQKMPSPDALKPIGKKKLIPSPPSKPSSLVDSKPSRQTAATSRKSPSPVASTSTKRGIPSSAEKKGSIKPISSDAKERVAPTKSSASSKPRDVTVKPAASRNSFGAATGRIISDKNTGSRTRTPRVAANVKLVPVKASSSSANNERISKATPRKSLTPPTKVMPSSRSSRPKVTDLNRRKAIGGKEENHKAEAAKNLKQNEKVDHKRLDEKMVQEKTLHVIEPETDCKSLGASVSHSIQSPSPLSPASLQSISQPTSHSFSSLEDDGQYGSGYSDTEDEGSVSNYEEDDMGIEESYDLNEDGAGNPGAVGPAYSKEKKPAHLKLKFRNGKGVELEPDTNTARKLRFRRGRVLGDNLGSGGDAGRRSFRKRAVVAANVAKSGTAKVVLRHQDVQGKKDSQGLLFNNMIEETASKLVETRKSKVKALVGAFETVISLQEGKILPDKSSDAIS